MTGLAIIAFLILSRIEHLRYDITKDKNALMLSLIWCGVSFCLVAIAVVVGAK